MTLTEIIKTISDQSPGLIIGAIVGIAGTIWTGLSRSWFAEQQRRKKHRLEVARHVLKICIEGSTCNYENKATDMKQVYATMTDLDGINTKLGKNLNKFISAWTLYAYSIQQGDKDYRDIEYRSSLYNEIAEGRKIIIEWANKIRVGRWWSM